MRAKLSRAITLMVVEVEEIFASLEGAKTLRDLTGQQRQQLQEAIDALKQARNSAIGGKVLVPVETLLIVLRCVSVTQQWLSLMLAETVADLNDY